MKNKKKNNNQLIYMLVAIVWALLAIMRAVEMKQIDSIEICYIICAICWIICFIREYKRNKKEIGE